MMNNQPKSNGFPEKLVFFFNLNRKHFFFLVFLLERAPNKDDR